MIEKVDKLIPIEIKSGVTKSQDYFKNLDYWNRISGHDPKDSYVVYAGSEDRQTQNGNLMTLKTFIHHKF